MKSGEVKTSNEEVKTTTSVDQSNNENSKLSGKSSTLERQRSGNEIVGNETKIPTNLIKYYGITCNTILGHSDLKVWQIKLAWHGMISTTDIP